MKRTPMLTVIVVIIAAFLSFALFRQASQQAASPNSAPYPLPTAVRTFNPPPFPRTPNPFPSPLPPPPFTPAGTPLPPPKKDPTFTPFPPFTPTPLGPPTPIQPITAWLTYTNTKHGYVVGYPDTWFLIVNGPEDVYISSYPPVPDLRGVSGDAALHVLVRFEKLPDDFEMASGQAFCIDGQCGKRLNRKGSLPETVREAANRLIRIEIPKGNKFYVVLATISNPPADAERNAALFERIIASFHFTP